MKSRNFSFLNMNYTLKVKKKCIKIHKKRVNISVHKNVKDSVCS